jgi:glycolate oxidase FAD binding subunit
MPDHDTCTIDDLGPLPVIKPQSVAEVGEIVRRVASAGSAVYPLGGRTLLNLGRPPTKPGTAVDLCRLDQVLDFPARDMTITVQAGIAIRHLQEIAAAENLRLPIDVPLAEKATVGGAIATNMSGPRRYGFGTLRDYVIGISVMNDEGQETKSGGRVVKNVAGYDLCKLHVGALGTLGIISQVTLKLKPLPEHQILTALWCKENLSALLDRLHGTRTRPVVLTVVSPRVAGAIFPTGERAGSVAGDGWLVLVGLEGSGEALEWQVKQLQREMRDLGIPPSSHWPDEQGRNAWNALNDFPLSEPACVTFKANLLPSETAAFCERLASVDGRVTFHGHAGNGIVIGHLDPAMKREEASPLLCQFLEAATAHHGNLTLLRCPPAWKKILPVWGNPRPDNWLMKTVKDKLDPRGLFNPGRFVAGI